MQGEVSEKPLRDIVHVSSFLTNHWVLRQHYPILHEQRIELATEEGRRHCRRLRGVFFSRPLLEPRLETRGGSTPGKRRSVDAQPQCPYTSWTLEERTMQCPRRLRLGISGLVVVGRKGSGTSALVHAMFHA